MIELNLAFVISAFVAGLLMFLAPCTLPLVPAYLGFISGVSNDDLTGPETHRSARRKIFWNGFFFVLGFSIVFILFGVLASSFGRTLNPVILFMSLTISLPCTFCSTGKTRRAMTFLYSRRQKKNVWKLSHS